MGCACFLPCKSGNTGTDVISLLGGLNEITEAKHLAWCRSYGQCPANVSKRTPDREASDGMLGEGLLAWKGVSGHWEDTAR